MTNRTQLYLIRKSSS